MGGTVVGWPEGRLVAAKGSAALGLGGLEGRAAGGADVVAVEAARPTEVHPVREPITGTGQSPVYHVQHIYHRHPSGQCMSRH